jgi:hypothetical protein
VLQAFNLHWFINLTKGTGIEVTFNDGKGDLVWGNSRVTDDADLFRPTYLGR